MERWLKIVVLTAGAAIAASSLVSAQTGTSAVTKYSLKSGTAVGDHANVPPVPHGKSTILGGAIRNVDPVLDQFTLNAYGAHPIQILFDARTQFFRDGTRMPLSQLRTEDHASVQTILDGSDVFALSIHVLSASPDGDCQGHVVSYNPANGELLINSSLSREPVKVVVVSDTQIVREGQSTFTSTASGSTDLINGSLLSVTFGTDKQGRAVAHHIAILATPGSDFVFSGDITSLDLHSGILVLVDPRDAKSYQISFDPGKIHASETLHTGDHIRLTASFDGARYVASDISSK